VYSIDSENLSDMQAELLSRMEYTCGKKGLSLLMLLVTDLKSGGSRVLLAGERQDIFFRAYAVEQTGGTIFLPGVLSRKKQVVPLIMSLEDEL
jgi:manganese-dependent inorganic pyrophosphatase